MNRSVILNPVEPAFLSFRGAQGVNLNLDLAMTAPNGEAIDLSLVTPTLVLEPRSGGAAQNYPGQLDLAALGTATFVVPGDAFGDVNGYRLSLFGRVDGIPQMIARGVAVTTPGASLPAGFSGGGTPVQKGFYNLTIVRGDSHTWKMTLWGDTARTIPSDLSGATVAAQIREIIGGPVLVSMTCEIKDAVNGVVWMSIDSVRTATLPSTPSYWDMQINYPDGDVKTPISGRVMVIDEVTT